MTFTIQYKPHIKPRITGRGFVAYSIHPFTIASGPTIWEAYCAWFAACVRLEIRQALGQLPDQPLGARPNE